AGQLVPDDLTIGLIRERLQQDDAQRGFVLDGFPRNLAQAEALDDLLAELGKPLDVVFDFQIDDEIARRRIQKRGQEEGRTDDTPAELDELAEEFIRSRGGVPTFKGYRGYPASICTSPNAMVVHGIPGPYALGEGDLLSIDVGVTLAGFVADSAYTFPVGEISADAEHLLEVGQAALAAGVDQCRAGNRLSDISHAIQTVTEEAGFSVVRSLVGHGVGRSM